MTATRQFERLALCAALSSACAGCALSHGREPRGGATSDAAVGMVDAAVGMVDAAAVMGDAAAVMVDAAPPDAAEPDAGIDGGLACSEGPRLPGDADCSGCVGAADLDLVLAEYGRPVPPGDPRADLNDDAIVDIHDRIQVLSNWGRGCPPTP